MIEAIQFQRRRAEVVSGKMNAAQGNLWGACYLAYSTEVRKLIEQFERMPCDDEYRMLNRRNVIKELLGLTEEHMVELQNSDDRSTTLKSFIARDKTK